MKKIFRYLGILVCLSLHAAAWGDRADNGVECSVVMEKTEFDARAVFPDFKLVFVNKGEKNVRLFDNFYPLKEYGPNISIKIFWKLGENSYKEVAWYTPSYLIEHNMRFMNYITLNPGKKHEVLIKDSYLLLNYLKPFYCLRNGKKYELEVRFHDGYGDPGTSREYVGKADFQTVSRSPKGALP